ncbi:unnamed protein product [Blepharisma stoltei]|uniref:Sphingomyelin phosphodiesterase n=1 Tax=Blepharisma stoltei TaxID=1481888 RepID=A0AAU9JZS1_9CILI|nr:unnamed protein product [Blepharisma stoltei]
MKGYLAIFLLVFLGSAYDSHTRIECASCHLMVKALREGIDNNLVIRSGEDFLINICSVFEHHDICQGLIRIFGKSYTEAVTGKYLNPEFVCSSFGVCPTPQYLMENFTAYEEEILKDMPEIQPWPETGDKTFMVLQVTDIHVDFFYIPGSDASCNSPLCCRNGTGNAGYWGTLGKCDVPSQTVEIFLKQVKEMENIKFVAWTGDNPPHDVWAYEREKEMDVTKKLVKMFKKELSMPVYPIIGNHECFPIDLFKPDHEKQLIKELSKLWKGWLGDDQIKQFSANGFYSAFDKKTGFRILGLNNELGDLLNTWLILNNTDSAGMLAWLRKELYSAEQKNEPVIILGHIPNGDSYMDSHWSRHYRVLANRFQNTIRGQFFGHTHNDEFFVVHSLIPGASSPGVLFAAPSFGTYTDHNPSFRLYEYDWQTHHLVNIHQYRLPLYKYRSPDDTALFEEVFNFKDEYNMADLSPSSFEKIVEKMKTDNVFAQTYYANWMGQYSFESNKCDERCQRYIYCRLQSDVFDEVFECDRFGAPSYITSHYFYSKLQGSWEYLIE